MLKVLESNPPGFKIKIQDFLKKQVESSRLDFRFKVQHLDSRILSLES